MKKNKQSQDIKFKISPASPLRKKAQMKIQQMSFMILGVFLFFVLIVMIVLTIKVTGLKQSATDLREQNALLLVSKLANSPEFSCGKAFGTEKTDCIDLDKVMMLKEENIMRYINFWGVSNIEIRRIYPENKNISCTIQNYPKCDTIKLISTSNAGYDKSNFVALCRKENYNGNIITKCEMGKLIIRYQEVVNNG
jgi:hypothetical protein